jgi:helicase-like protein
MGEAWQSVTKDAITTALRNGGIRVLVCTDAASEGLNLQAAGALINYDLPWNPSKVEQRIGRIDRIGQRFPQVRVVNLFLTDSVDERVYTVLRRRCGLFTHFVGPMQPVLARARRMLLGEESESANALESLAGAVEAEPLARETYVESEAEPHKQPVSPLTHADMREALGYLTREFGLRVRPAGDERYTVTGIKGTLASSTAALERNPAATPFSPLSLQVREIAERLSRPGERLPLVIGSYQAGAFRASMPYWMTSDAPEPVETFDDLRRRVESWDGRYPDASQWLAAQRRASREAEQRARAMAARAEQLEAENLTGQIDAARLRLLRELGRYLACLGAGRADLNDALYQQMARDIATAQRLKLALDRLGGTYPDWPEEILDELEAFRRDLSENQRRARLLGKEIDAAVNDPRWVASGH